LYGQLPLTETRECLMSDCCQFAPANPISCDQLMKSNNQRSDLCITTWKQRDCLCPSGIDGELEPGNFTQCAWDNTFFDNPPISFDRFQDFCLSPDQPDGTVDCNEFLSNGTCAAYTFEIGAGVVSSVSDISEGDCNYSDANCWDGFVVVLVTRLINGEYKRHLLVSLLVDNLPNLNSKIVQSKIAVFGRMMIL
jgi:hypothetical protein